MICIRDVRHGRKLRPWKFRSRMEVEQIDASCEYIDENLQHENGKILCTYRVNKGGEKKIDVTYT